MGWWVTTAARRHFSFSFLLLLFSCWGGVGVWRSTVRIRPPPPAQPWWWSSTIFVGVSRAGKAERPRRERFIPTAAAAAEHYPAAHCPHTDPRRRRRGPRVHGNEDRGEHPHSRLGLSLATSSARHRRGEAKKATRVILRFSFCFPFGLSSSVSECREAASYRWGPPKGDGMAWEERE